MAFKEVQDLGTDTVIAIGGFNKKTRKDNPTGIEGYYLGSRSVTSAKSKGGKAKIHVFQTPKGNVGVWGKTDLDQKLGSVTPGTMTQVKFDKMVPSKNGEMYKFKVAVDTENTIEVTAAAATEETTETSDYNTDADYDTGPVDEETDEADAELEAQQAAASLAAAKERQARVQAQINKRKST